MGMGRFDAGVFLDTLAAHSGIFFDIFGPPKAVDRELCPTYPIPKYPDPHSLYRNI